jgi:hypothetical protein
MTIRGVKEESGPWYVIEHDVIGDDAREPLGRTDWADWTPNGDLVFTRRGALWRAEGELPLRPRVIADFADRKFRELAPPLEATRWGPK